MGACEAKMRIITLITAAALMSSCGQITRILNGTEKLPSQIEQTNEGIVKTNEAVRKQKIGEALKVLKDPTNRSNLFPVPFDMMSAAKVLAEAITPDEAVLFVKNYILKIRKQTIDTVIPPVSEDVFMMNRIADYYMIMLISGFLPDETVNAIIAKESKQGAYQDVMFNILKLRADFNNDMMLYIAMLGLDPVKNSTGEFPVLDDKVKLDTLGKIKKAIEYNEKVEFICNLDFVSKIDLEIEGIVHKAFSADLAKNNWQIILDRAQADYKANSLSKDPAKNEEETQQNAAEFQSLITRLQNKVEGKP